MAFVLYIQLRMCGQIPPLVIFTHALKTLTRNPSPQTLTVTRNPESTPPALILGVLAGGVYRTLAKLPITELPEETNPIGWTSG